MLYNTLLDSLEDVLRSFGEDYQTYDESTKKIVAANIKITETIKAVLDTPLIDTKGNITKECENLLSKRQAVIREAEKLL